MYILLCPRHKPHELYGKTLIMMNPDQIYIAADAPASGTRTFPAAASVFPSTITETTKVPPGPNSGSYISLIHYALRFFWMNWTDFEQRLSFDKLHHGTVCLSGNWPVSPSLSQVRFCWKTLTSLVSLTCILPPALVPTMPLVFFSLGGFKQGLGSTAVFPVTCFKWRPSFTTRLHTGHYSTLRSMLPQLHSYPEPRLRAPALHSSDPFFRGKGHIPSSLPRLLNHTQVLVYIGCHLMKILAGTRLHRHNLFHGRNVHHERPLDFQFSQKQ